MRTYKVPPGHHHTHAGVKYLGPADIPMSDEDYIQVVGTVMEARKIEVDRTPVLKKDPAMDVVQGNPEHE